MNFRRWLRRFQSRTGSPNQSRPRARLRTELLEDRTVPAAFAVNGSALQLDLATSETVAVTTNGTNYQFAHGRDVGRHERVRRERRGDGHAHGDGRRVRVGPDRRRRDQRQGDVQQQRGAVYGSDFTVVLDNNSQGITFAANSQTHFGSRSFFAETNRNIAFSAVLDSTSGNITLRANQQATPTAGSFVGIELAAGTVRVSGTGALTLAGRGGNGGGGFQYGVSVHTNGLIQGGTAGVVTVQGTGGASAAASNYGVHVQTSTSRRPRLPPSAPTWRSPGRAAGRAPAPTTRAC